MASPLRTLLVVALAACTRATVPTVATPPTTAAPSAALTVASVRRALGHEPNLSVVRPASGWSVDDDTGRRCLLAELRNGVTVQRVDRYALSPGAFAVGFSWYFFDLKDRVVDVEWEAASPRP